MILKKGNKLGNDFVMIDNRKDVFEKHNTALIAHLCNRRTGVGADGLILLESEPGYDFRMVYFNADGHQSSMCGNGGRCIVAFARKIGLLKKASCRFMAIDGEHTATIDENNIVKLGMKDVIQVEKQQNDFVLTFLI